MSQQFPQYRKVFIKVTVNVSPEGDQIPLNIRFEDVITCHLKQRTRAASTKVGGTSIRYTIVINGTETYLFKYNDRWFVEAKGNVRY